MGARLCGVARRGEGGRRGEGMEVGKSVGVGGKREGQEHEEHGREEQKNVGV